MSTRSPFPDMDPWLESVWESVHTRLIVSLADQIGPGLPAGLLAEVEETVVGLEGGDDRGRPNPGVAVFRSPVDAGGTGDGAGGGAAVARPVLISIAVESTRQRHVAIRSFETGRPLVTAIELLSPTNKRKRSAREAYVAKRAAGVNVLEIDLVRAGGHLIDVPLDDVPADLVTPYKACVHRGSVGDDGDPPDRVTAEYYPIPLRSRVPLIAVPLRPADDDLLLDAQRSLDEVDATGQYAGKLDYASPPDQPLPPADAAWAAERVAAPRSLNQRQPLWSVGRHFK